jgi:hypothetical protein
LLDLTREDARKLLVAQRSFRDALVIANAYGLDSPHEWTGALYQQVVVQGDTAYLKEFVGHWKQATVPMVWDLAKRFDTDAAGQQAARSKNFRTLLLAITPDHFLRYDVACKLRMDDVAVSMRSAVPGIKYFRK